MYYIFIWNGFLYPTSCWCTIFLTFIGACISLHLNRNRRTQLSTEPNWDTQVYPTKPGYRTLYSTKLGYATLPNQTGILNSPPNQTGIHNSLPNQTGMHNSLPNRTGMHNSLPYQTGLIEFSNLPQQVPYKIDCIALPLTSFL